MQDFILTSATLKDKTAGFTIADLPDTIKDALSTTHKLGIKYIWIDALCIIQDSETDKRSELPRMASYYSNSYVTICASTGNCKKSFLSFDGVCKDHPNSGIARDLVPLSMLTRVSSPASRLGDPTKLVDYVDDVLVRKECPWFLSMESISARAWTFQERVLSPRILFFGDRLGYQCHSIQQTAGGVDYSQHDAPSVELKKLRHLFNKDGERPAASHGGQSANTTGLADGEYDLWYKAAEEITRRDITAPADKLPAISALAQVFKDSTGDDYLAGLWRGDLLRGLLWSTYPTLALDKPQIWRAPTWSWASHENTVSYKGIPPLHAIPIAKVLEATSTPLSELTPLGEVSSGVLKIEGPVLEMDNEFTKKLMQQENEQPGIQDKPETRYELMGVSYLKNKTDRGCRDWEAPEGHLLLILLATPVRIASKDRSVRIASKDRPETNDQASEQSENQPSEPTEAGDGEHAEDTLIATEGGSSQMSDESNKATQKATLLDGDKEKSESIGFLVSGLVLGPSQVQGSAGELQYEWLARFTTIGAIVRDYRELKQLSRTVTII